MAPDILYTVEVDDCSPHPNRTKPRRNATHPDEVVHNFKQNLLTSSWDVFQRGLQQDPNHKLFGWRNSSDICQTTDTSHYQWLSYRDVEKQALNLGSFCLNYDLVPITHFSNEVYEYAKSLRLLGLFSKNCVEWFITEQASNAYNFALVPFYDALREDALLYILKETRLTTVAGSVLCLNRLLNLPQLEETCVKNLIVFDAYPLVIDAMSLLQLPENQSFNIYSLKNDIFNTKDSLRQPSPGTYESLSTLCYTSGTTGNPKAVMLTQQNLIAAVSASIRGPLSFSHGVRLNHDDIHYSYLPLAHVFERIICNVLICLGASIGLISGEASKILDDICLLKPTIFISVPKLYTRIYDRIFQTVSQNYPFFLQKMFHYAVTYKLHKLHSYAHIKHFMLDKLFFKNLQRFMGGQLRYMLVGSASLDTEIQNTLKVLFCVPMCEGYGLTETFGASFVSLPEDPQAGTIGGPLPCVEFCLQDVSEMNFYARDSCGELLLRGPAIFPGYFCNVEATKESLDSDKWFFTGDIVRLLPNGALKIIDRKKNIFKLAQGEYVAPEKLESIYEQCKYISQIYVYGDSTRHSLVAIIAPNDKYIKVWGEEQQGLSFDTSEDLYSNETLRRTILQELTDLAQKYKLSGLEKIKNIVLVAEHFTIDNGLLTPTFKIKRHAATQRFLKEINEMYRQLDTLKKK